MAKFRYYAPSFNHFSFRPANLFCLLLRVMQGEARKPHSVCSRFELTPLDGLSFIRTWPSAARQCESIKQQKNVFCAPAGRKKIYLALALAYSAFWLVPRACSAYGSSPIKTSLSLRKKFLLERTWDKKFFFWLNIFPVGRPSRVGRALGAPLYWMKSGGGWSSS